MSYLVHTPVLSMSVSMLPKIAVVVLVVLLLTSVRLAARREVPTVASVLGEVVVPTVVGVVVVVALAHDTGDAPPRPDEPARAQAISQALADRAGLQVSAEAFADLDAYHAPIGVPDDLADPRRLCVVSLGEIMVDSVVVRVECAPVTD